MTPDEERKETANAFAREWVAAWNSHDVDRIVSHYVDNLTFISPLIERRFPALGGVIRDTETLHRYVSMGLEKRPDLHFTLLGVLHSALGFIIFYRNAFDTHTAEYLEINEDGKATLSIACYSDQPLALDGAVAPVPEGARQGD